MHEVFISQKKFGERAEDAEIRDRAFQKMLGEYTLEQVYEAMEIYCKRNDDMPAPGNIIQIIEPEPRPLSTAFYLQLKKKKIESYCSHEEYLYISVFERNELDKAKEW